MPEITTESAAVDAARAFVAGKPQAPDPVVADTATDHGWCWTVPWRTRASAESGQPMAPGTGPVIVFKADGETAYLGSAPLQVQLDRVKQMRGIA